MPANKQQICIRESLGARVGASLFDNAFVAWAFFPFDFNVFFFEFASGVCVCLGCLCGLIKELWCIFDEWAHIGWCVINLTLNLWVRWLIINLWFKCRTFMFEALYLDCRRLLSFCWFNSCFLVCFMLVLDSACFTAPKFIDSGKNQLSPLSIHGLGALSMNKNWCNY